MLGIYIGNMKYLLLLSTLLFMPQVYAADIPEGTRIQLSATAEAMLPNDEVVISFRIEAEGENADALRQQVNRTSSEVAARLKREPDLKLTTTNRNMQPLWEHPKNAPPKRIGWMLSQQGEITSTALDKVPAWLDAIEKSGAMLNALSFRVSRASSQTAETSLRQQALQNFRTQAAELAQGLDAPSFRIMNLNTNSRLPRPMLMRSEMAMMADHRAAAAALSAGESTLSISVNGEILVPSRDFPARH